MPQLRSPVLVCAFRGWNDAAGAASTALAAVADSFDAEPIAQVDPEDYFDFQATRPTITLTEGQTRQHRVAAEQPDRDPRPRRRPRPRPARRHRAEPALAHLLGDDRDGGRRARGRDGDHPGGADRRGLPHPAGADHRPRLRRAAGRGARPAALQLRGPDRDRRRRPRLLPADRDDLGLAVGGGAALRRRGAQPEGGAGAAAPARGADRDRRRRHRAGGGNGQLRGADRPRRRRQPGDRRAGGADRGRAGRAARREREDLPSADTIAREFQHFLRQQGN